MRHDPAPRRASRAVPAALVALLVALAAVVASPSGAAEEPSGPLVGLTWKMSNHAFTSTSLAPAHATTAPATKTDAGFTFPETSSVTYDPGTQAGTVTFPGAYELGNVVQGNYRIRIADPTLTLDGDGTGSLSALLSYALTPAPETPHSYTEPTRVVVANLTLPDGALTDTGSHVSITVTPDFEPVPDDANGYRQFPQAFLDALHSSLRSHFRQSGSGSDANKAPAHLTVGFAYGAQPVGLTWKMSNHAFTSTSLAPAHATTAPATKTDAGFTFPETSSVTYDPGTGIGEVTYPGAYELGNVVQGNYRIRIADPTLTLDGDGTGSLSALLSYALTPAPETPHSYTEPVRVVVANLTLPTGAPARVGDNVQFTVVPDFEPVPDDANGYRQFPQAFLDALHSSLRSHFRQSGSGSDANKPPAPLRVSFDLDADDVFVRHAYRVVLGRAADSAGLAHWVGRLEAGASRDAVANALAATAEGQRRVVEMAYQSVLHRPADPAGRSYWVGRVQAGLRPENLVANLLISGEAIRVRAGDDPEQWVELLFQIHLGRAADEGGLAYWTGRVEATTTSAARRTIALGFGRTGEATTYGVRTAAGRACGTATAPTAEQRTTVTSRWTGSGSHPLRTAGTALATICPTAGPPAPA